MGKQYRSWDERRRIIRAVIADSNETHLDTFGLSDKELLYFRARAERAVHALARQTSGFKEYYRLPTERPFGLVVAGAGTVIAICLATFIRLYRIHSATPPYPIYAALISITAVAAGWIVTSGTAHKQAVRQNTQNIIFARFSHAPFGEALFRFHKEFGHDPLGLTCPPIVPRS